MGNALNLCGGIEGGQQITVYGDYFDPDTRSLINILSNQNIPYDMKIVDTLDDESQERENYRN